MNEHELAERLRAAFDDGESASLERWRQLAVQTLHHMVVVRRRRRIRCVAGVGSLAVALALALALTWHRVDRLQPAVARGVVEQRGKANRLDAIITPAPRADEPSAEPSLRRLAALESRAQMSQQTVRALLAQQRLERLEQELALTAEAAPPEPIPGYEASLAAAWMFARAQRLQAQGGAESLRTARRQYQQLVDAFSETRAAERAAVQLAALPKPM